MPLTAAAGGRTDRCGAVVHPPAEQGRPAPGVRARASWSLFAAAVLAVYAGPRPGRRRRTSRRCCMLVLSSGGGRWWRCCCCASVFIWRCCTRRTTRSSPTSRCCARTADMSFPTWRSARRAGWRRGRRRGRRARRDVTRARCAATRSPTGHDHATPDYFPGYAVPREPTSLRRCNDSHARAAADLGQRHRGGRRGAGRLSDR